MKINDLSDNLVCGVYRQYSVKIKKFKYEGVRHVVF